MRIISKTIDISVQDQLLQASAPLSDFLVLDIETTGLSVQNCAITEIGAVKIKNGEVLERFNTFSIYQVLPRIIELWRLNVRTEAEAKKNFVQQSAR